MKRTRPRKGAATKAEAGAFRRGASFEGAPAKAMAAGETPPASPPPRPLPTPPSGWMSDDSAARVPIDTAARQRAHAAARASGETRPVPLPLEQAAKLSAAGMHTVFQQRLSERPADIRDAARALAREVGDQIDDLNASTPNDEDGLAKHNDLVSFLERIAAGLTELGEALDRVVNASAKDSSEPVFLGKAGEIAHQLNVGLMEFLERNRAHIAGFPIRTGLFLSGYWFLNACGVEGYIAGIASGLLNASLPKAKTRTAEKKNQNQKKRRSR